MNNKYVIYSFNLISIILVIILYVFIMYNYIIDKNIKEDVIENFNMSDNKTRYENIFKYKPSNARIMYNNTGELPWNRHLINSSIPYDINIKQEAENVYYYEYDNNTYNEKLRLLFKNNCEEIIIAVEGNKWGDWINPKTIRDDETENLILQYYNNIIDFITKKINDGTMNLPGYDEQIKIQIVHDILLRYRINQDKTDYYMFDIDLILYRPGKFQGKHVKILAISNNYIINIIFSKIIGVISEDNIILHPFKGYDIMNKNDFNQYVPMKYGSVETDFQNSSDNTFEISDEYANKEIESILYKKLLRENIPEDVDISNNNYIPLPGEIIKRDRCRF